MGGGDDCFLSDIWISLAALGMLTQERQLPWAQALPGPLPVPGPSLDTGGTGDDTPQTSLKDVSSPLPTATKNIPGLTEPKSLGNFCSQLSV